MCYNKGKEFVAKYIQKYYIYLLKGYQSHIGKSNYSCVLILKDERFDKKKIKIKILN